ncbi:MAG TPA: chemotaxis protein CheW [Gemmatimonadales bacterium]
MTQTKVRSATRGAGTPASTDWSGPERLYAFADSVHADADAGRDADATAAQWETWVTFRLGRETFGFGVETIQEIVRVDTITRVPHAPYVVRGIINLRGRVVPVVDLRVRLGLPASTITSQSRILIAASRQRVLGLLVDAVEQVVRIDRHKVDAPPDDVMTSQSEYIIGVLERAETLLILLDSARALLVPDGLDTERTELT